MRCACVWLPLFLFIRFISHNSRKIKTETKKINKKTITFYELNRLDMLWSEFEDSEFEKKIKQINFC